MFPKSILIYNPSNPSFNYIKVGFELSKLHLHVSVMYCRFGNFRVIFISRIFHFRIIHEFLNSRVSMQLTKIVIQKKVYSILARTLNLRGNELANISEN